MPATNDSFRSFRPEPTHPETVEVSEEELGREEAQTSPEGRPANPRLGFRGTMAMTIGVIIVALGVTGVVGYFVSPWLAVAMLIVGGLCATVFNPVVWAAAFRARDNEQSSRRAAYKHRVRTRSKKFRSSVSSRASSPR